MIGTLIAATIALVIATPIAIGVALFISHFAPRQLASGLGYVVDLLAAIPSVVYGAWGAAFLAKEISPAYNWLANNMGWLPDLPGPGLRHRQDHPDRGHRAGRDGPAHHHLPEPRNLPADPQAA